MKARAFFKHALEEIKSFPTALRPVSQILSDKLKSLLNSTKQSASIWSCQNTKTLPTSYWSHLSSICTKNFLIWFQKFFKKVLDFSGKSCIIKSVVWHDSDEARGCCDGKIHCRFSVERMSSLETGDKSLYNIYNLQIQRRDAVWYHRWYTRRSVQSPLVVLD